MLEPRVTRNPLVTCMYKGCQQVHATARRAERSAHEGYRLGNQPCDLTHHARMHAVHTDHPYVIDGHLLNLIACHSLLGVARGSNIRTRTELYLLSRRVVWRLTKAGIVMLMRVHHKD